MGETNRQVAAELAYALLLRSQELAAKESRGTVMTAFSIAVAECVAAYPDEDRAAVAKQFFDHMVERVNEVSRSGRKPLSSAPPSPKLN